jgi:hypothetical protein
MSRAVVYGNDNIAFGKYVCYGADPLRLTFITGLRTRSLTKKLHFLLVMVFSGLPYNFTRRFYTTAVTKCE